MKLDSHSFTNAPEAAPSESASVAKAIVDSELNNSVDSNELSISEFNDCLQNHLSQPGLFDNEQRSALKKKQ